MIFIDDRIGSKELADLINNAILTSLEFGDCMFYGNGRDGEVEIGIERKRIGDLVNSIMTGRLSGHQLPGLISHYYRVYIIVEGILREDPVTKELQIWITGNKWGHMDRGGRKFALRDVWNYLSTLEIMTGVIVRQTRNAGDTARHIEYLKHWWDKPWDQHHGHLQLHKLTSPTVYLEKPSLLRRIASELPGIGWARARAVDENFGTVKAMVEASEKDWIKIEGIGKVIAKNVWRELHK